MSKYNFKKDVQERLTKTTKVFKGNNGKEYKFKFDDVFSEEKKGKFIKEFIVIKKECDKRKENPNYEIVYEYLIVKYFTDVLSNRTTNPYDDCLRGLDTLNDLNELGIYYNIFMSIDKNQIDELNKHFSDGLNSLQKILDDYIREVNSIENERKNNNK